MYSLMISIYFSEKVFVWKLYNFLLYLVCNVAPCKMYEEKKGAKITGP